MSHMNSMMLSALLGLEPEVPEEQRPTVAWGNVLKHPANALWAYDQDGRLIYWYHHGQYTQYGWHVHHRQDQALGGRHTASNLVARHWEGNTRDGGTLGALLNALLPPRR